MAETPAHTTDAETDVITGGDPDRSGPSRSDSARSNVGRSGSVDTHVADENAPTPIAPPAGNGTADHDGQNRHATDRRVETADLYMAGGLGTASVIFALLYSAGDAWAFRAPLWQIVLASVLVSLPLIYRHRWPSHVAWVQSIAYGAAMVMGAMEPGVSQIALFMGVYSIGALQRGRKAALLSRTLLCIAMFGLFLTSMVVQFNDLGTMTVLQYASNFGLSFLINIAFFGGAWVFGDRAWKQRQLLAELQSANAEVAAQERQLAQQALDLERVRIARELHDGVAHHIAGVGIHAAAARRSLDKSPETARSSLLTIEKSTRETIEELRTLVYTLRDAGPPYGPVGIDTDRDSPGAPRDSTPRSPGLGDLPELIESTHATGLRVTMSTIGTARTLSRPAETTIYRVVQESLTNSQRYAGSRADVAVRLRYGPTEVELEISDTPAITTTSAVPPRSQGTGTGIIGMRERLIAVHGTLTAGPKSRGGWLVRAVIPYPGTTSQSPFRTPHREGISQS